MADEIKKCYCLGEHTKKTLVSVSLLEALLEESGKGFVIVHGPPPAAKLKSAIYDKKIDALDLTYDQPVPSSIRIHRVVMTE